MNTLWDLFIAFLRASNFSFGGGPAMIPLIQAETVDRYKFLSNEEFTDTVAISNSLPAPIATKLAAMIGYKVKGWPGAIVAIIGVFLPTTLVVVLLGSLVIGYADSPALQAMLKAVRPVVVVLLAITAFSMGQKAFLDVFTWIFGAVALVVLFFTNIHPAFLIISSMAAGYLLFKKANKQK